MFLTNLMLRKGRSASGPFSLLAPPSGPFYLLQETQRHLNTGSQKDWTIRAQEFWVRSFLFFCAFSAWLVKRAKKAKKSQTISGLTKFLAEVIGPIVLPCLLKPSRHRKTLKKKRMSS
uniref:Uncharacterized protein n=1 Tax=Phlegmariurus squarrosus TaxID=73615 RepID=H9M893_PHLSQ|nr:hypothetical protein HusqMp121 [Phlegmariurus squarrosus]AEV55800.1 hypothetical protein HusqMp121 [Phlegmariurus squarrosus]